MRRSSRQRSSGADPAIFRSAEQVHWSGSASPRATPMDNSQRTRASRGISSGRNVAPIIFSRRCRQRRDNQRHLRVPHDGAEFGSRHHPIQGNAGDPCNADRSGDLDDGAIRRRLEAATAASGRALKIVARGVNRWGRTIGNLSMTGTSYYRLDRKSVV